MSGNGHFHLMFMGPAKHLEGSLCFLLNVYWSALKAQSDARPTDDQKVGGSIPAGSGNSLS